MDNTITTLEFCAGYGGIGLGLKNIFGERLRCLAYCELEGFAQANLISKMEKGLLDVAPLWNDLKTFPYGEFHGLVDILIAGYPCQPFSAAGKRAGKEDPRHLWPWIADGIRILRPRVCFFENVEGHISLGLSSVISDLEELGYKVSWGIFSAREVGAPHQRKRVFILAHDTSLGIQGRWPSWIEESRPHVGQALPLRGGDAGGGELADAECPSLTGWRVAGDMAQAQGGDEGQGLQRQRMRDAADHCGATPWPSRPGEQQFAWEPPRVAGNANELRSQGRHDAGSLQAMGISRAELTGDGQWDVADASLMHRQRRQPRLGRRIGSEVDAARGDEAEQRQAQPPLGGNSDGPSDWLDYAELCVSCDNRTDELRLLGNGVVPATAERAFRTLTEILTNKQP